MAARAVSTQKQENSPLTLGETLLNFLHVPHSTTRTKNQLKLLMKWVKLHYDFGLK